MDRPDPLAALRDIHLPAPSGDTVADFALAALVGFLAAAVLVGALYLMRRRFALRRAALAELAVIDTLAADERLVAQAKLLRRIARSLGDETAVSARGETWLNGLDRIFATDFFSAGEGRAFGEALYAAPRRSDDEQIHAELRRLIGNLPC